MNKCQRVYVPLKKNCVDETQSDMLGLQPKQFNLYQSAVHTELKCGSNFIISYFLNGKKLFILEKFMSNCIFASNFHMRNCQ